VDDPYCGGRKNDLMFVGTRLRPDSTVDRRRPRTLLRSLVASLERAGGNEDAVLLAWSSFVAASGGTVSVGAGECTWCRCSADSGVRIVPRVGKDLIAATLCASCAKGMPMLSAEHLRVERLR
jgi:hypothetical protein